MMEKYLKKQKEDEELIKVMNRDLHIGHIRHNVMCSRCFDVLGKKKVNELLKEKEAK